MLFRFIGVIEMIVLMMPAFALAGAAPPLPPTASAPASPAPEVLARGPIHEAYAEPVEQSPTATAIVPKAAAATNRGNAARTETGRRSCRLVARLLVVRRRTQRLYLDQRLLAHDAAGQSLDAGKLAQGRCRLAMGRRHVGQCPRAARSAVSAATARARRSCSHNACPDGDRHLCSRLLGLEGSLRLAARILDRTETELDLDSRSLPLDSRRLRLHRRLLGLRARGSWHSLCAGVHSEHRLFAGVVPIFADDRRARAVRDGRLVRSPRLGLLLLRRLLRPGILDNGIRFLVRLFARREWLSAAGTTRCTATIGSAIATIRPGIGT